MKNNQKFSFIINFNSYNPHAYVIQNGYFLKFFPKQLNIKNSMIIIDKETNNEFKININLKDLRKKVIETNTNINNEIKINYFKEKNINNQLDVIYQTINFLKKQGLSNEEILEYLKNILYNENGNTKQKTKTLQK